MDPNSTHQLWSRWTATITPDPALWPLDYDTVKENCARFYRKAFGSATELNITRVGPPASPSLWTVDCRTEGHPAHDPDYVEYMTGQLRTFLLVGFGPHAQVHIGVQLEAGSRQDGTPPDQLVLGAPPIVLDTQLLGSPAMANALYPKFKQALLNQEHKLSTNAIIMSLVRKAGTDTGGAYTYSASHVSRANLGTTVADSPALATATITDGVFDTADFVWTAVPVGAGISIVAGWNDTPVTPTTDPLVVYYDNGMTGMPVIPNGGNINFTVHPSGWFAL